MKEEEGGLTWIHILSLLILYCHPSISSGDKDHAEGEMLTKAVAEALERNVKLSLSGDAAIVNASKAAEMEKAAQVSYLEGYREFAYFVFNVIAFYGYLFCCEVTKDGVNPNSLSPGTNSDFVHIEWGAQVQ